MNEVKKAARMVDLGLTDYAAAYALQLDLVERRWRGAAAADIFLVTEHPATFTLGRRGGRRNLMVSEEYLRQQDIPLVAIERGGDITYHGPGQLVIYPILHLRRAGLTVTDYVHLLEETMIRLAAAVGVMAGRDPRNPGIWAAGRKMGSVGIAIRHGVAFHGLALNVNVSLDPFSWVNPCGLSTVQMTSLSRECGREVAVDELKEHLARTLRQVFAFDFLITAKEHPDVAADRQGKEGEAKVAQAQPARRSGI